MKKLCIVVPYRDRAEHLEKFLPAIKEKLTSENIDYHVLVVEQSEEKLFNRGKLLNIGFDYTKGSYDYYCFHDVDMLPIETDYSYCNVPTHLAGRASQFMGTLPYESYFGGVTLFDRESFVKVNGFSNDYWGWGAEDDDILRRCFFLNVTTQRKNCSYQSLDHVRPLNPEYNSNLQKFQNFESRTAEDSIIEGLSTLEYELLSEEIDALTTKIKVRI